MALVKYTCPHCKREFPGWYWGTTGKWGGYATVKKPGLARANFERHKKACELKPGRIAPGVIEE